MKRFGLQQLSDIGYFQIMLKLWKWPFSSILCGAAGGLWDKSRVPVPCLQAFLPVQCSCLATQRSVWDWKPSHFTPFPVIAAHYHRLIKHAGRAVPPVAPIPALGKAK